MRAAARCLVTQQSRLVRKIREGSAAVAGIVQLHVANDGHGVGAAEGARYSSKQPKEKRRQQKQPSTIEELTAEVEAASTTEEQATE